MKNFFLKCGNVISNIFNANVFWKIPIVVCNLHNYKRTAYT